MLPCMDVADHLKDPIACHETALVDIAYKVVDDLVELVAGLVLLAYKMNGYNVEDVR